jgi:hypothetical protein
MHPGCDPGVRQGTEVLKADITIGDEQYEIQYPTDVSLHRAILYLFRDHSTQDRLTALHYCSYDRMRPILSCARIGSKVCR